MAEMTIETLEESLRQAMLSSDILALDELIADDLIFTLPTGLVIDKQADLEAHRSGIQKFTQVETDDLQIHHHLKPNSAIKAEIEHEALYAKYQLVA